MKKIMNNTLRKLADNYMGAGLLSKQNILDTDAQGGEEMNVATSYELSPTEVKGLRSRAASRITRQEIQNQINLEDIISWADQNLACEQDFRDESVEIDIDWFNQFSKYAMGVSSDVMKKGWAKVLATEIRNPNSFSLRTLNLMSMLSRQEAETIRKLAKYVVYSSSEKEAYILNSKQIEEIEFDDILLLGELKLIDSSSELGLTIKRLDEGDFNCLFRNRKVGLFFNTEKDQMFFRIYKLTTTGVELMKLNNDVNVNIEYLKEYAESLTKIDKTMNITCSDILNLSENNVDLDEQHPYFRIGPKYADNKQ